MVPTEQVRIITPDNGVTLADSQLTVVGTARPTSTIVVYLDDIEVTETQTDEIGNFSAEVLDIEDGEHVIAAEVLDGEGAVVGSSEEIAIRVSSDGPALVSVSADPETDVLAGTPITLSIMTEPGLQSVLATLGDSNAQLTETQTAGEYVGQISAPSTPGQYSMLVSLTNILGLTSQHQDVANINVIRMGFENIATKTDGSRATFSFEITPDTDDVQSFRIDYETLDGATEGSVLTLPKGQIRQESGEYKWYIDLEYGDYRAEIVALDAQGEELDFKSDPISFSLALNSAPTCTVDNISGVTVEKKSDRSIIRWDDIPAAAEFHVYKKDAAGEWVFVDVATEPSYTIHIAGDNISYSDYAIKAAGCGDEEGLDESEDFSEMVRVQT